MRCLKLLPVAMILAAPMAAQECRGTISMRMSAGQSGQLVDTKVYIADGKQAMVMTSPSGPMAGSEMRIVTNPAANTATILISTTMMPGAKGLKMVSELGGGTPPADAPAMTAKPLGTTQTIAGMRCEDYEVTSEGQVMRMCMTEALGRFALPDMSGGARGPQRPGWVQAFGNRALFPLKVTSADSRTSMEVTAVERGAPPAAMFDESPEGYATMPAGMPGMRRN